MHVWAGEDSPRVNEKCDWIWKTLELTVTVVQEEALNFVCMAMVHLVYVFS